MQPDSVSQKMQSDFSLMISRSWKSSVYCSHTVLQDSLMRCSKTNLWKALPCPSHQMNHADIPGIHVVATWEEKLIVYIFGKDRLSQMGHGPNPLLLAYSTLIIASGQSLLPVMRACCWLLTIPSMQRQEQTNEPLFIPSLPPVLVSEMSLMSQRVLSCWHVSRVELVLDAAVCLQDHICAHGAENVPHCSRITYAHLICMSPGTET